MPVGRFAGQEGLARFRLAKTTQGGGRLAPHGGMLRLQEADQSRVAPFNPFKSAEVGPGLLHRGQRAPQREANHGETLPGANPGQRPERPESLPAACSPGEGLPQEWDGLLAPGCQRGDRSIPNLGSRVVQQVNQRRCFHPGPVDLCSPRILRRHRPGSTDPVNGTQHLGLGDHGGRAAKLVPPSRVQHQQAAIGIFLDVGRMKVDLVGYHEVAVLGPVARALGNQAMPHHLAHVE